MLSRMKNYIVGADTEMGGIEVAVLDERDDKGCERFMLL